MSLILNESVVLAKTRCQDLKSVLKLNCWGSGIKDVSLVRQLTNVEVIGLSCNEITSLEDFAHCKKLKELILRGNKIKNISEIAHLQKLPSLNVLWLQDNPCVENTYNYRKVVLRALPQLKVLDNKPVTKEELQEIEELGDEIYEEVPYESTSSLSSGPQSNSNTVNSSNNITYNNQRNHGQLNSDQQQYQYSETQPQDIQHLQSAANTTLYDQSVSDASIYQPNETINETISSQSHYMLNDSITGGNRTNRLQHQSRSSRGSMNALNGSNFQPWSGSNNNNNMNILPKGGKVRNSNILSAVLCLIKELDYSSCEVVATAVNCRMEETLQ